MAATLQKLLRERAGQDTVAIKQPDPSPKARPRYVWQADELPHTATNKIVKRELIDLGTDPSARVIWTRRSTEFCPVGAQAVGARHG
ncbi:hypothetical protein [Mycobacterium simiae]|uniref:hypothetical protein n=1 Tax=Mycobacterium simiae TaxID=1784 RepID=UPI00041306C1|nr:hypothetical protein X011_07445 [Mycobacterium tuberculosis variant microti OV254]BBX42923.1 hypothetical protein MSIM_43740 [Mycobacterium simiae]